MPRPKSLHFLLLCGITLSNFAFISASVAYSCRQLQDAYMAQYGRGASISFYFPRCLDGGYFGNVQCKEMVGCYCTYLDTGNWIPQTVRNRHLDYMHLACPWQQEKKMDPCAPPPVDFPCREKSRKFYYNPDTGDCIESTNGCLGFDTVQACEKSCVVQKRDKCNFKLSTGWACDRRQPRLRWYHNEEKGSCRPFKHEGCGGNSNNYKEQWKCLETCEPLLNEDLVIEVGKARYIVSLPKWLVTKKLYIPSVPNKLNVSEFKEIENHMVEISRFSIPEEGLEEKERKRQEAEKFRPKHAPENMTSEEICNQPEDPGPCRAFQHKWYFEPEQSKCIQFSYGGCEGNENRHLTATGCAAFCNAEVPPTEMQRILDLIASGGTIGGPLVEDDDSEQVENGARTLSLGPSEGIVGSEAEIEIIIAGGDEATKNNTTS